MARNSIFSVLRLGLDSLGGQCPHRFLGRCPQWLLKQWLPRLLLRGAPHMSLEEPKPPQALAAAQKVAGAHGAGECWLPAETQAQIDPWTQALALLQQHRRTAKPEGQFHRHPGNWVTRKSPLLYEEMEAEATRKGKWLSRPGSQPQPTRGHPPGLELWPKSAGTFFSRPD